MRILTAAQIRAVEERAVDTGLDYLRLMGKRRLRLARVLLQKKHRLRWNPIQLPPLYVEKAKTAATAS